MPNWKKVVVSGSSGHLVNITASNDLVVSGTAHILGAVTLGTDLVVAHGGTGASSFTAGTVLLGSGTDPITALAVGNTQIIIGDGSGDPTVASLSGDVSMTNGGVVSIVNDKVVTAKILNANVTTAKLADGAVTTAKIGNDQVTGDKLANSITIAADITVAGSIIISTGKISYGTNTNVDIGTENVATATGAEAAFFDYVVKNSTNVRAGTITAATDGTNVEYNEISTVDLGNTSDIKLKVVLDGSNLILQATAASDDWNVSSFIRYMAL